MNCISRQTTIYRNKEGTRTEYRCLDKDCDIFKTIVDNSICDSCPLKKVKKDLKPHDEDCPTCGKETEEFMKKYPDGKMTNFKRITNYSKAIKEWVTAGRPTRTEKEVDRIHKICVGCDWYDKESSSCKGCGCKVSQNSFAVMNKIKMATESCPQDKW